MNRVEAVLGDIVQQRVDAVVNAANNAMRGGGGVDGAIHRAGGPAVLRECTARFPNGLATGDAGFTTAGDLPAHWVIHTVGPNYAAGQRDPTLLRSAYTRSLQVADELGAQSVAFPLISAGVYGWPLDDAMDIAISTLRSTPTTVRQLRIVTRDRAIHDRIQDLLVTTPPTVGALFAAQPERWGLRGDTYLWRELERHFADLPLPAAANDVPNIVASEIERWAGVAPSGDAAPVYVSELDPGHGMSAGMVDLAWWASVALPMLEQRARQRG